MLGPTVTLSLPSGELSKRRLEIWKVFTDGGNWTGLRCSGSI